MASWRGHRTSWGLEGQSYPLHDLHEHGNSSSSHGRSDNGEHGHTRSHYIRLAASYGHMACIWLPSDTQIGTSSAISACMH